MKRRKFLTASAGTLAAGAVSLLGLATLFTLRRRRNRSLADIG